MKFPELEDVRIAIMYGAYDNKLTALKQEIDERVKRTREFVEWFEGERVRINEDCRPKYLVGELATVVQVSRTKVSVKLDRDSGRFRKDSVLKVPVTLLEKV